MKLIVAEKENPRRRYIVKSQDWMNPDKFTIRAQVPYIGSADVINKDNYEIARGGIL